MERHAVKSSLIKEAGYDPQAKVLELEFIRNVKKDVRTIYRYPDFSQEDFNALMGYDKPEGAKHSIGSHFLKKIKARYDGKFTKVEEPLESTTEEAPQNDADAPQAEE